MRSTTLHFREARATDLGPAFALSQQAIFDTARRRGFAAEEEEPDEAEVRARWRRHRPLMELIAAQAEGCSWVCEEEGELVGHAEVARFGAMEELTTLMVRPSHHGRGVGRRLLEHCWPKPPSREGQRTVVAAGAPADLTLYMDFGVMPVAGHWHLRQRAAGYLERRSHEATDASEPDVHVLESDRAVGEWSRLEPLAMGHARPALHAFFARSRTCLGSIDDGGASALCWVSGEGEIGPAVARTSEALIPVVLAALDRVAKAQEPEWMGIFCTTDSWWLLRRLRSLGFQVYWPSWVMCSVPLPGLDRYVPTRPPRLL
ncbi:MAG: GNAT family N-acetyltransferase [Actinomycetota bacterium]|nr:GNAT family N-acetyltransferase [Actinomycetota bacterium]